MSIISKLNIKVELGYGNLSHGIKVLVRCPRPAVAVDVAEVTRRVSKAVDAIFVSKRCSCNVR